MIQTNYDIDMQPARAGMRADATQSDTITRLGVYPGGFHAGTYVVPCHDTETQAEPPLAASKMVSRIGLGVIRWSDSKMVVRSGPAIANKCDYDDGDPLPIMRSGHIWVLLDPEVVIVPLNSSAYVRYVPHDGPIPYIGTFRHAATDGNGDTVAGLVKHYTFRSSVKTVTMADGHVQKIAMVEMINHSGN